MLWLDHEEISAQALAAVQHPPSAHEAVQGQAGVKGGSLAVPKDFSANRHQHRCCDFTLQHCIFLIQSLIHLLYEVKHSKITKGFIFCEHV